MSISLVRQSTGTINNTSLGTTVTLSGAAAAGNYLFASIAIDNATSITTISSITTTNVSWSKLGNASRGNIEVEIWLGAVSATSGTTVTFAFSGAATTLVCNVSEWNGVTGASPVDVTAVTGTGSGTSASTGSYTTITANDIVFAVLGFESGSAPSATPSGYAALTDVAGAGFFSIATAYKTPAAAGAQSASWTIGAADWESCVVALKPLLASFAHGVAVSLGKATAVINRSGKAFGVGNSFSKCSGTIIKYGAAHGIGTGGSKGTLEKYFGSLRGLAISTSKCAVTVNRTAAAHGLSLSRSTALLRAQTLVGKGHGVAISASKGRIQKRTLPPPSSTGLRVGTWTTNKPAG